MYWSNLIIAFLVGFFLAWGLLLPRLLDWQITAKQLQDTLVKRNCELDELWHQVELLLLELKRYDDTKHADWWKE